jgi:hypothetical protein
MCGALRASPCISQRTVREPFFVDYRLDDPAGRDTASFAGGIILQRWNTVNPTSCGPLRYRREAR